MSGFFLLDKVVKLVGGGSVINGAYPVQFSIVILTKTSRELQKAHPLLRFQVVFTKKNVTITTFTTATVTTVTFTTVTIQVFEFCDSLSF